MATEEEGRARESHDDRDDADVDPLLVWHAASPLIDASGASGEKVRNIQQSLSGSDLRATRRCSNRARARARVPFFPAFSPSLASSLHGSINNRGNLKRPGLDLPCSPGALEERCDAVQMDHARVMPVVFRQPPLLLRMHVTWKAMTDVLQTGRSIRPSRLWVQNSRLWPASTDRPRQTTTWPRV